MPLQTFRSPTRVEVVSSIALAGQNAFFVPWGVYIRAEDITFVTINGVAKFVGVDYTAMLRQVASGGWPQASTADVVRGIYLTVPALAGDVIRFTFTVRTLVAVPPQVMPVYAPGGVFPVAPGPGTSVVFGYTGNVPQQILTGARKGLQVEFWRRSKAAGRVREALGVAGFQQVRAGRHWSPYFRSPVATEDGTLVIDPTASGFPTTGGQRRKVYRLAYYEPTTGARTALSTSALFVASREDRINGAVAHPANSAWVSR